MLEGERGWRWRGGGVLLTARLLLSGHTHTHTRTNTQARCAELVMSGDRTLSSSHRFPMVVKMAKWESGPPIHGEHIWAFISAKPLAAERAALHQLRTVDNLRKTLEAESVSRVSFFIPPNRPFIF